MKKYIIYILLTCLLLSCFAGCKQNEVTPTDVTPTDETQAKTIVTETDTQKENSVSQEQPEASEEQSNLQEQSVTAKKEATAKKTTVTTRKEATAKKTTVTAQKEANTQSEPKSTSSVTSKVVPVKKPIGNVTGYKSDEVVKLPTFTDEETMQNWFKGYVPDYFTEQRNATLQQNKNQKFVYYRPTKLLEQPGELNYIEYDQGWYVNYNYHASEYGYCTITVQACLANHYEQIFQWDKEAYAKGERERFIHDGIDYYYYVNEKTNALSVHWQQFGYTHMATIYNYQGKPEALIPLLKLDQVTINLNSDHVTQ